MLSAQVPQHVNNDDTNQQDKLTEENEGGIQQPDPMQKTLLNLVFRSMKRTHDLFSNDYATFPEPSDDGNNLMRSIKRKSEYGSVIRQVEEAKKRREQEMLQLPSSQPALGTGTISGENSLAITDGVGNKIPSGPGQMLSVLPVGQSSARTEEGTTRSLLPLKAPMMVKPKWHAPWKLYRVISGHTGWVRAVDVEPQNQWFASGGADRIIKIWDLASGKLRLSLTGHISSVRAVKISPRHPFLFSGGEDKQVKCWDLEYNKVIRHYHGHLSAVQALSIHPTLDVLVTSARDSTARVWDMRTKAQVHCFAGHTNTVSDVVCQAADPQVITSSHDATVRLWDLAAGRSMCTLTHHKKSVRALALHPRLFMFASASPDNIKQWKCPKGEFMQNLSGHNAIVNSLACNEDGVLVSGGDNGSMCFWDWRSGFCFQKIQAKAQPGSIDSEAGIYAMCYDKTGLRLITAEADKTIKMYKEDDEATEESHPIVWRPEIVKKKAY
uniref:Pleiotropic regulator 1 n=1 Tax=Heterorhabditis bacteriophora TaxID=37862 RepID=A0A1I7XMT6_HETBA